MFCVVLILDCNFFIINCDDIWNSVFFSKLFLLDSRPLRSLIFCCNTSASESSFASLRIRQLVDLNAIGHADPLENQLCDAISSVHLKVTLSAKKMHK